MSPHAVTEWLPFVKAGGFFFASCFLEDVAAIGAGLLIATGDISWPAAFTACFLGIWVGDTGIYGLARIAGRSGFERSWLRRFAPEVARSERWFAERGTPILVFSRMIPAARLPTYLAAGFLRLPLSRFLMVTGPASFVWVFFVLFLSRTFGKRLAHWLDAYKHAGLLLIAVVAGVFILLQVLRRVVMRFKSRQLAAKQHLDDSIPATRLDGSG